MGWYERIMMLKVVAGVGIRCSLNLNPDELLTVPAVIGDSESREMVLDTGSFTNVVFGTQKRMAENNISPTELQFQILNVKKAFRSNQSVALQCERGRTVPMPPTVFRAMQEPPSGLIGGIVAFSPKTLAKEKWAQVAVSFPPLGENISPSLTFHSESNTHGVQIPLNSYHYWSFRITSIRLGDTGILLTKPTSVIFDTGTNYFGVSPGLWQSVTLSLGQACTATSIVLGTEETPDPLEFLHVPLMEGATCAPAVFHIDQSRFAGALSHHEIILIGTRGLRGKTLSLHKHTGKDPEFYLSLN